MSDRNNDEFMPAAEGVFVVRCDWDSVKVVLDCTSLNEEGRRGMHETAKPASACEREGKV